MNRAGPIETRRTNQIGESEIPVRHNTLDLVKLRKMGCVHRFVSENPVDAE
jgi:hypothetical protein